MILVVDDHEDLCQMLKRLLKTYGLAAECVTDPRDALGAVLRLRPGCIILDDHMPEVTGLDLLRELRNDSTTKDVPVVMYSAHQEHERLQEARRLGAADWVTKGTPFERLVRRVREVSGLPPDIGRHTPPSG